MTTTINNQPKTLTQSSQNIKENDSNKIKKHFDSKKALFITNLALGIIAILGAMIVGAIGAVIPGAAIICFPICIALTLFGAANILLSMRYIEKDNS